MRYFTTKFKGLNLRETNSNDTELIFTFIREIAEYEKMTNDVICNEDILRKSLFEEKRAYTLIVELNNRPIGYAMYFFNFSTFIGRAGLYVEDIFLRKEYRGKGYGKEIFRILAKIARENSCERMEWVCLKWNEPSLEFYKSLGAKPLDEWTTLRLTKKEIINLSK